MWFKCKGTRRRMPAEGWNQVEHDRVANEWTCTRISRDRHSLSSSGRMMRTPLVFTLHHRLRMNIISTPSSIDVNPLSM